MRVSDVQFQIERIKEVQERSDNEVAHSMEDELHLEVLKAIAEGSKNARRLAAAALKSGKLGFSRHCA